MLAILLTEARVSRGWSVVRLGMEAELSPQQVRRLEKGIGSIQAVEAVASSLELRLSRMPVAETLVGQVRAKRQRAGISAAELASKAKVSRMTVRAVEAGAGSMASLERIVSALVPAFRLKAPPQASWARSVRRKGDEQYTPREFLEKVESVFGPIDLDPAWHPSCRVTAARQYSLSLGDDGLAEPWRANVVWLNPPYSQLLRWIRKADAEWSSGRAKTIVALAPARTDSSYFHDRLVSVADVYLLRKRLRFVQADGKVGNQAPFSLMLILFGTDPDQRRDLEKQIPGLWIKRTEIQVCRPNPLIMT